MSVTELIKQVKDDREEYEKLQSALDKLSNQQVNHPALRYTVAGHSVLDIQLPCGGTLIEQIVNSLAAAQLIYHDRITRNNKILATADALVRGLQYRSQDHEPE